MDLQEKVKRTILREQLIQEGDLVLIAVSGGADSLSLLYILNELRLEGFKNFNLHVAHLDHGLRGEQAAKDAQFVRLQAKKLSLPCTVGKAFTYTFAERRGLSLEDAARRLRYKFLEQVAHRIGASTIATGHTLDDQAETVLLNLLRGTGPEGLAGIRFKRRAQAGEYTLIRPLLEIKKEELEGYCRKKNLSPRFDRTNEDTRFLRNKIRLELIPALEKEYNPNFRESLARLSFLLSLDSEFLSAAASRLLEETLIKKDPCALQLDIRALLKEHEALQGRILRRALAKLAGKGETLPWEVSFKHIRALLNLCKSGLPYGSLQLPLGLKAVKSANLLTISSQPPHGELQKEAFTPFFLPVPGKKALPYTAGSGSFLQAELIPPSELRWPPQGDKEAYLDYERVLELSGENKAPEGSQAPLRLYVRTRRKGDLFYPLGAPGRKKLKKYFIDQKIPLQERERIPLVLAGGEIVWVVGKQISHLCRITEKTKRALVLKIL